MRFRTSHRWAEWLLSVLRIVTAFLFVEHGTQKWFAFPAPRSSPTELWSLSGVAGVFELVGGVLLLLGLFARPVAFVLSGLMAAAYFIAHAPRRASGRYSIAASWQRSTASSSFTWLLRAAGQ